MNSFLGRWNSVKAKLLRTIIFAFSIGICISGATLLFVGNQISRANLVEGLGITAKIIADRSAAALVFSDPKTAESNLSLALSRQNIDSLCLYDGTGNLFVGLPKVAGGCDTFSSSVRETSFIEQKKVLKILVPVVNQGDWLGHLLVEANTGEFIKSQALFSAILVVTLLVSLSVAYWVSNKLLTRSLEPLNELYRTSKNIARDPLSGERAEKISNDEVGRVVDVFNAMLDGLSRENQALIYSENRFRSLAENAPIGVYSKSEYSDYEYINHRWCEITGLSKKNAASFVSRIDEKDRKNYKNILNRAFATQESQTVEFNYNSPDSGGRILMEHISPVMDENANLRYVGSLLDVTELKSAQVELEKLAFYDPLTQLPNRRFFKDHLLLSIARAKRENKKIAIYLTDLDNFKKVNDSLGHEVGDKLLVDISFRLKSALYDRDMVSRMGGDEFMILLDNIEDPTRLDIASSRVVTALSTSARSGGQEVKVTGSVGIAIYPTDSESPEELIRYADIALYSAKGKGGDRVSYYSKDLDRKIKEKLRLEQKLRSAIIEKRLDVFIQPQYLAGSRKMFWGEALVRWFDSEEGFIPPDVFIPLAEETGLIQAVGDFVLDRVLALIKQHIDDLQYIGVQGISVNLSGKQFFAEDFAESIANKFAESDVDPKFIEFEITETTLMDDIDRAVVVMECLRDLGCQLSIDDFGTGYSSLAYLKRFPINSLKIDKSFIRDIPEDQSDVEIACAIIAMAHNLGLTVVAEGVETEIQARLLAQYDCEYLQGFFLDRPMPIEDLLSRRGFDDLSHHLRGNF